MSRLRISIAYLTQDTPCIFLFFHTICRKLIINSFKNDSIVCYFRHIFGLPLSSEHTPGLACLFFAIGSIFSHIFIQKYFTVNGYALNMNRIPIDRSNIHFQVFRALNKLTFAAVPSNFRVEKLEFGKTYSMQVTLVTCNISFFWETRGTPRSHAILLCQHRQ